MKKTITPLFVNLFIISFSFVLYATTGNAQQISDTLHLAGLGNTSYVPTIKIIADPSSYGPYTINTKHTNVYFVTDLPTNTSKVILKYVDVHGEQLGESKIEEGSNIEDVEWTVKSEDVGFVLSPQLNVEVHYKTDSVAIYNMAYTVYPDTVQFSTTSGWGPFVSNAYPLSDGWQPVEAQSNSFTLKNLPPRTDTLEFQILAADSSIIQSYTVTAPAGEYLDSAVFANIRMDSLPLSTEHLKTLIWCDGGPKEGLSFHNKLEVVPQKSRLVSKLDGTTLVDSIGVFVENDFIGQALLLDSAKYAEMSNGPGKWDLDRNYRGPYCFDLFSHGYSIEAWLKFDLEKIHSVQGGTSIMSVDSVWNFRFDSYGEQVWFSISSLAVENNNVIFTAKVPFEDLSGSEWHHVAITSSFTGNGASQMDFYLDGKKWENTVFHEDNYWDIGNNLNYYTYMKTQPLYLGYNPALFPSPLPPSYIVAMDEVRLWNGWLSAEEVKNNYHKKVLQKDWLVGYWNFDDLRNRLGYISDLSYKNNTGRLKNGATFIPQYPLIQTSPDTLMYYSSNTLADSVIYSFIDRNEQLIAGDTSKMYNGGDTLLFDVSVLPDNISKLNIREYSPGSPDTGFLHTYHLEGLAPMPIATPRYNWGSFYTAEEFGVLNNAIVVSGLPNNTTKVELGFQKDEETFDLDTLTENSIPYRYSLSLNGTDNYVETTQNINSTTELTMSFWFKTTTTQGGKIIGFTDTKNGVTNGKHDREVIMEKDGSLRFNVKGESSSYTLSAVNKYNDGNWHNVKIRFKEFSEIEFHVDGCIVDVDYLNGYIDPYSGYWIIGRNNESKLINDPEAINEYFEGSVCEVILSDYYEDDAEAMATIYTYAGSREPTCYYKFDEGKGTVVNDYAGSNTGELKGSSTDWFTSNTISFVAWDHNILNKMPGIYDFFARVFYNEGPPEGVKYLLGRNMFISPFPEHNFTYNMSKGFGYFNEGTALVNFMDFWINGTDSDSADWKENFLQYKFFTLDHLLISQDIYTYTTEHNVDLFSIDMGDAPPGSYLSLEVGYHTTDNTEHITNQIAFPLYINPMLAPIVSGSFGPFDQAIAPGVMEQLETFVITTEILSDLNKVKAKFYDKSGKELGETDAEQLDDTTWHFTYDMAELAPPTSKLAIEYYLGQDPHPALVQGPFPITIHKTRPKWFDFIPDTSFHEVQQTGDKVTFSVVTPFEENFLVNNSESLEIPEWVPMIGGTSAEMKAPNANAKLKYTISEYKLELNEPPDFFQKVFNLGAGTSETLRFGFNYEQHNTYSLDSNNNLLATQNFSSGGSATSAFKKLDNIVKKVKELIEAAEVADPETIIVSPSFNLTFAGSFQYASRQHLMVDTTTGKWGSFGSLKIDANPEHEEAFKNSASFKFYSGAMGVEFSVGAELLEGLVEGDFGLDGRFVLGFGHSYISIPNRNTRPLKSFAFQTYGRFYVAVLWGWYEKTIWGPDLYYSTTIWGDDMTDCFPPTDKKAYSPPPINANSSWPELTDEVQAVRKFSKMPMPVPEPIISSQANQNLFTWVERGNTYGERGLAARYFNKQSGLFSETTTIELNNNALNNPVSNAVDENLSFFTWAQTRYDNQSILKIRPLDALTEFVKAQDIWFAIYDLEKDSIILKAPFKDDTKSLTSGRAEANPALAVISDSRVLICWQVADLDNYTSEFWYAMLEKTGENWMAGEPQALSKIDGIATNLQIVSTGEDKAVITWLNTSKSDALHNTIMTAIFDGNEWSSPEVLLDKRDNYYNYLSLNINNGLGGLLFTSFVEDSALHSYEVLSYLPWETDGWLANNPLELMADSVNHLQLPVMAIREDGKAAIAVKVEELVIKENNSKISQVDLLLGDLNYSDIDWKHIEANTFVCDTNKQVADLQITYAGGDTLMVLLNEYSMLPTNTSFVPQNGIMFGDPYMNLVLRSFAVDDDGNVHDVNENDFFTAINQYPENKAEGRLYQNYPNPCSESTTITFDISDNARVKLELFDMKGNKVATLMEQQLSAGRYEVKLNTALLKPGTYIYRLTSDNYTTALRMMVGN